jgi:MoaA/NifB/PqqE/SkfB family radical SAM enzyme
MGAYYQLAKKIIQSNFCRLSLPYKLSFILTYKCNYKCKICNIWAREPGEAEMTLPEIEEFFLKNNYISWLNLGGGEIFLREDINQVADIIYTKLNNLVLLDFATTGFFTDRVLSFVQRLDKYKPKKISITVSLDGPKETHEWLRGVPGSWDKAIETFKGLRSIGSSNIKPYLGYTLSKYNFDKFFDTVKAVKKEVPDIGLDEFHINLAQVSELYYQNEDSLEAGWAFKEKDRIAALLGSFLEQKKKADSVIMFLEGVYQSRLKQFLNTAKTPLNCRALSASCFIDPAWNVYPCVSYNRAIANLKELSFDLRRVWNLPACRQLQKEIIKSSCPNCWTPCEAYQTIFGNLAHIF